MSLLNRKPKNTSLATHPQLFLDQLLAAHQKFNIPTTELLEKYEINEQTHSNKIQLLTLMKTIESFPQTKEYLKYVKQQIMTINNEVNQTTLKKQSYLLSLLSQLCLYSPFYPISLHHKQLKPSLRRILWSSALQTQESKQQFFKYNNGHYANSTLQQQLRSALLILQQRLTEQQLSTAINLLYFVRTKYNRVPRKCQYSLALMIVNVFSCHKDVGGIYVSLLQLCEYYKEENPKESLCKAIKLVANSQISPTEQLVQQYEAFRMSFGATLIEEKGCEYLLDMCLLREKCVKDMYVYFAMAMLTQTNKEEKIKEKDIVAVYNVIYQHVPIPLEQNQKGKINKLLEWLREQPKEQEIQFIVHKHNPIWIGNVRN